MTGSSLTKSCHWSRSQPLRQILYHLVNRDPRWLLDRAYAPWPDLEELLRDREIPIWGIHYRLPLRDFDRHGHDLLELYQDMHERDERSGRYQCRARVLADLVITGLSLRPLAFLESPPGV